MSEKKEKKVAETKSKKNDAQKKKGNPFKKMGAAIKKFFKDFKGECKKVTWPTGKTVLNNSLIVIVVVAVVGLVIFGIDTGLSAIIDGLVGLASKQDTAEAAKDTAEMIGMFFLR